MSVQKSKTALEGSRRSSQPTKPQRFAPASFPGPMKTFLDKQTIERVWQMLPKLREELYGLEWTLPIWERDGPRSLESVRQRYSHWEPWEIDRAVRFQEDRNRQRVDNLRCQIEKLKAEIIELEKLRRCGAKTRSGHPCQCYPLEGKRRCAKHGGKSTGCRTPEGRERLREAGRKTMALRLAARGS